MRRDVGRRNLINAFTVAAVCDRRSTYDRRATLIKRRYKWSCIYEMASSNLPALPRLGCSQPNHTDSTLKPVPA